MFRKFLDGVAFGTGFGIACAGLYLIASFVILPSLFDNNISSPDTPTVVSPDDGQLSSDDGWADTDFDEFYNAPVDEQIESATAIALAEYVPSNDGRMRAVISEYLKQTAGVEPPYAVGDEHPRLSYYPTEGEIRGDGLVIFFAGSRMMMSTTFRGGRISGLSDIPLDLFREKCSSNGGY